MKKYILLSIAILTIPFKASAFSIFDGPIAVPAEKAYVLHQHRGDSGLPNIGEADVNTTMLVYTIQAQAVKSTEMFYIKDNQIHQFENSEWAIPISKMLTVALFEYILNTNAVTRLAFQDINIRQDFTLSGTTPYGPILNLDTHKFYFYITFYLTNEKTKKTLIKTIKFEKSDIDDNITADQYVDLTNIAINDIFAQLRPWLIEHLKIEKNKKAPPSLLSALKITSNKSNNSSKDTSPNN